MHVSLFLFLPAINPDVEKSLIKHCDHKKTQKEPVHKVIGFFVSQKTDGTE